MNFIDLKLLLENQPSTDAEAMAAYMKNQFSFLGIKSPQRKLITKSFVKQYSKTNQINRKSIIHELWQQPFREYQYIALDILHYAKKNWEENDFEFLCLLIQHKSWWDTVDYIASHGFGSYFLKYHSSKYKQLDFMINHKNMWLNRSAIIHQLQYGKNTDMEILQACILPHLLSKEFFIQKAIGWSLRQYSKYNKAWVKLFIENNNLSSISLREAKKYL